MMPSLTYFDDLVDRALTEQAGNLNDLRSNVLSTQKDPFSEDSSIIRIGHLLALLPESRSGEADDIKHAVATFLAVRDFNRRQFFLYNQSHVFFDEANETKKEASHLSLYELTKDCNFYMTYSIRDSGRSGYTAGMAWQEMFFDSNAGIVSTRTNATSSSSSSSTTTTTTLKKDERRKRLKPFAVVGPSSSHISAMVATLGAITETTSTISADFIDGNSNDATKNQVGVVVVSPSSTASYLDNKDRYPYFARTVTSNSEGIAESMLFYYRQIGVRQLAVLHSEDDFARDVVEHFLKLAGQQDDNSQRMKLLVVSYVEDNSQSMQDAVQLLLNQTIPITYYFGIHTNQDMILELYDAGLIGQRRNCSEDEAFQHNCASLNNNTSSGRVPTSHKSNNTESHRHDHHYTAWTLYGAVVGRMTNSPQLEDEGRLLDLHRALHRSTFIKTSQLPDVQVARDKLKERFSTEMDAFLKEGQLYYYNPDNTTADTIDQKKTAQNYLWERHDQQGIYGLDKELFWEMINTTTTTTVRDFTYDAVMALGIAACQIPHEQFTTPNLYQMLKQVEFQGATGYVSFDSHTGTRTPRDAAYAMTNLIFVEEQVELLEQHNNTNITTLVTLSQVISNESTLFWKDYKTNTMKVYTEYPILYADDTTTPLPSIPLLEEDMNLVPLGLRAFCWAVAGLVVLCSVVCAAWTIWVRQKPSIRASQPIFLVVLCCGTFCMGLSILPMTFQEPMPQAWLDFGCMFQVWLLSIGFSMTFAALFTKTWRICKIFQNSIQMRRRQVLVSQVAWVPSSVFGLNILVLTIWTVVDPLQWDRVVLDVDIFDRAVRSQGTCYNIGSVASPILGGLLVLINGLAFLIAVIETFKARHLPCGFNETFYMTVSSAVILEAFLIGIPIMFVLNVNTSGFMVVGSWIVAIAAFAVLFPMFLPKMIDPKKDNELVGSRFSSIRMSQSNSAHLGRSSFLRPASTNFRQSHNDSLFSAASSRELRFSSNETDLVSAPRGAQEERRSPLDLGIQDLDIDETKLDSGSVDKPGRMRIIRHDNSPSISTNRFGRPDVRRSRVGLESSSRRFELNASY